MSDSKSTATAVAQDVTWASVIGAIDEIGGTLERMRTTAFSDSIVAMSEASQRTAPFIVAHRRTWKADGAKRTERDYTADHFIAAATTAEPKTWARFGKVDGKRTATNLAAVRFVNFALHHTAVTEQQYKGYSDDWDFDAYCDWLPTAWRYTKSGNLIGTEAAAEAKAEAAAKVKAEVSADTRMFSTDVLTMPEVKNAQSAADRLVELRSLAHDADAQYKAAYAAAKQADKSAANTAYKARFNAKAQAKIAKGMAAKGYAD
jgi:hypothetical protein